MSRDGDNERNALQPVMDLLPEAESGGPAPALLRTLCGARGFDVS